MSKVSIITACFNSELEIESTYESILNQTYQDWEWLVTDDCSVDNTYDILNKISKSDKRVKVFKLDVNSGAAAARNNSISHSNGDFIAFIDSDDLWYSKKLQMQIELMQSNSYDFSFTSYELIDSDGKPLNKFVDTHAVKSVTYHDMLQKKATLGCSTVILRRSSFKDLKMPLLRTGQDYALWLKLLKTGCEAFLLQEVLSQYRILPNSISRNKFKKARRQWQIYREIEKLSLLTSIKCFLFYAYRAVFRK